MIEFQTDCKADLDAVAEWIQTLWPKESTLKGVLAISWLSPVGMSTKLHKHTDITGILKTVKAANDKSARGIYLRSTAVRRDIPAGRGKASDSTEFVGFALDMDVEDPLAHKKSSDDLPYPSSYEEIQKIVRVSGLPTPTMWVASGYGFYPWWLLDGIHELKDNAAREEITTLMKRYEKVIQSTASDLGFFIDSTAELSRVLRIPGTLNRKNPDNPRECKIIDRSGQRYTLDELWEGSKVSRDDGSSLEFDCFSPSHALADVETSAMDRCVEHAKTLAEWPDHGGNAEASRRAFFCGQYAGAGQVDPDEVLDLLIDAVTQWEYKDPSRGSLEDQINTVRSQFTAGMSNPRVWTSSSSPEKSEIVLTGDDAAPTTTGDALTDWATPHGQARWVRDTIGGILYLEGIGWHLWDGKAFLPVTEKRIRNLSNTKHKTLFDWAVGKAAQIQEQLDKAVAGEKDELETELERFIAIAEAHKKQMTDTAVKAMMASLADTGGVLTCIDEVDSNPYLLNTQTGIWDALHEKLLPHDQSFKMTRITAGGYREDIADTEGFRDVLKALKALPDDVISWWREFIGSSLLGTHAEGDFMPILSGVGNNGKSLLTTDGILPAVGTYGRTGSRALLASGEYKKGAATPDLISLQGVRFVLFEELPEGRSVAGNGLKDLLGTSTRPARGLHKDEIQMKLVLSPLATTNNKPQVTESDYGTWRRMCLIPLPYRFVDKESSIERDEDRVGENGLRDRMRTNSSGQWDAWITWLCHGMSKYLSRGTERASFLRDFPPSVREATDQWRRDCDPLLSLWEENFEVNRDSWVVTTDVHKMFNELQSALGQAEWSARNFLTKFETYRTPGKPTLHRVKIKNSPGSGLSRPDDATSPLAGQVWGYRGIRFRDTGLTCTDEGEGEFSPF